MARQLRFQYPARCREGLKAVETAANGQEELGCREKDEPIDGELSDDAFWLVNDNVGFLKEAT